MPLKKKPTCYTRLFCLRKVHTARGLSGFQTCDNYSSRWCICKSAAGLHWTTHLDLCTWCSCWAICRSERGFVLLNWVDSDVSWHSCKADQEACADPATSPPIPPPARICFLKKVLVCSHASFIVKLKQKNNKPQKKNKKNTPPLKGRSGMCTIWK